MRALDLFAGFFVKGIKLSPKYRRRLVLVANADVVTSRAVLRRSAVSALDAAWRFINSKGTTQGASIPSNRP